MAAANVYTVYKAEWDSETAGKDRLFAGDDEITGITDISWVNGAEPQAFFADGDKYAQFGWIENVPQSVQVTTGDLSQGSPNASAFVEGDLGQLKTWFPERASVGLATGSTFIQGILGSSTVLTLLESLSFRAGQAGAGSLVMNFIGMSADGSTSALAISAVADPD